MHIVRQGETLQSIALAYFGDAGLWYLIADANGLATTATPTAGQSLVIPNKVTNLRNASDTFKPYNPGSVIGDTTPSVQFVAPPPPPKKTCGALLQALVIVVAVVVTIYAPYAAGLTSAATTAAAAGSAGTAIAYGAAAGAVGAAAGSAASQLTANAVGLQQGFSFSAVGRAALVGGVTAGLASGASVGATGAAFNNFFGSAASYARGALLSAASQGVNIALGQQEHFSWASLAGTQSSTAASTREESFSLLNIWRTCSFTVS